MANDTSPVPVFDSASIVTELLAWLGKPDSVWMSQIRHALTAVGAIIISKGVTDSATVNELVGAAMILVGDGWAIFSKYAATHWLKVAVKAPDTTTMPQLAVLAATVPSDNVTTETVAAAVQAAK